MSGCPGPDLNDCKVYPAAKCFAAPPADCQAISDAATDDQDTNPNHQP